MNIQGEFPLGLTSLISLQSKGLPRVFSSTTIQNQLESLKKKRRKKEKEIQPSVVLAKIWAVEKPVPSH